MAYENLSLTQLHEELRTLVDASLAQMAKVEALPHGPEKAEAQDLHTQMADRLARMAAEIVARVGQKA